MSLTLTLEPNLEERLRLEAQQRGLSVELWLAQKLEPLERNRVKSAT